MAELPALKPCPWCGPGQSQIDPWEDHAGNWQVGCGRCGAHSGSYDKRRFPDPRAAAIAAWNQRATTAEASLAEAVGEIERLRAAYEDCAKIAEKYAAKAEKQLANAKRRQHSAGLLLAAGYQGDPDGDVSHTQAIVDTARDIAFDIRAALAEPKEG